MYTRHSSTHVARPSYGRRRTRSSVFLRLVADRPSNLCVRACVCACVRACVRQCGVFDVETVRAGVEWGSFTTSLSAPSTIVAISPPGAANSLAPRGDAVAGTEQPPGAVPLTPRDEGVDSATEDVSATSIDTSAM